MENKLVKILHISDRMIDSTTAEDLRESGARNGILRLSGGNVK